MATIRQLGPADRGELERFLTAHAAQAMFLRSNLAQSGIRDGAEAYCGRYVAAFDGDHIVGIAAHYWNNILLLLTPDHPAPLALAAIEGGRKLSGIIGPLTQVEAAKTALPLNGRNILIDSPEDLFQLSLSKLKLPDTFRDGTLTCRLATRDDIQFLGGWRLNFDTALNGAEVSAQTRVAAENAIALWIDEQAQFILFDRDRPVAGCCFNARLPDMVQIGNVWTPVDLRSRGYARAVVAGALLQAREAGITSAILFTGQNNHAARKAYLALGFTRVGDYAIVLLDA